MLRKINKEIIINNKKFYNNNIINIDFNKFLMKELKEYCKNNKIRGFSKKKKSDLINYIQNYNPKDININKKLNPYILFCKENRNRIKNENPTKNFIEISKIMGIIWRSLTDKEKDFYKKNKNDQNILNEFDIITNDNNNLNEINNNNNNNNNNIKINECNYENNENLNENENKNIKKINEIKENDILLNEIKENDILLNEIKENDILLNEIKEENTLINEIKEKIIKFNNKENITNKKEENIINKEEEEEYITNNNFKKEEYITNNNEKKEEEEEEKEIKKEKDIKKKKKSE
jgi:hypothetical protein